MALELTVGGVDRTSVLEKNTLYVEQQAANFISICSFVLTDIDGDIAIAAEDAVSVVDGATTFFAGRVVDIRYTLLGRISRHIHIKCQDLNVQLGETVIDQEEAFAAEADADIIDLLFDDYLPAVDSETHVATIQDPLTITVGPCTLLSALSQICTRTGGYFYVDFDNDLHYFTAETDGVAWFLSDTPDEITSFPYLDTDIDRVVLATTRLDGVFVVGAGVSGWRGTHAAGDRQGIARDNRITTTTGRDERGDAILNRYGAAQVTYTVKTYKAGLRAGMDVRFVCALYGVDDTFTVRRMVVRWDGSDTAYYILTLGDVVNPSLLQERKWTSGIPSTLGPIPAPLLPTSSRGWSQNIVFSATDNDTVAWAGAGEITLADGTVYTINAGNTGNMGEINYIYLDIDTAINALQVTDTAATAVGSGKILIAVAEDVAAGKDAIFQAFGGSGQGMMVTADNIVALTITGNEINANSIAAGHIVAGAVETDKLAALAVTAAKIAANTITAGQVAGNTITAAEVAANTLTAAEIAAATITGTEIAGATIVTGNIAANTIVAGNIAANTITAAEIAATTITATEIVANTITAAEIAANAIETDELSALAVTAAKIAANTITADKISMGLGDALFNNADGLLLFGPYCEISPTEWWSLRKQKATLSGAFHQEAGKHLGTRALMIEAATTNRIENPSLEINTTSWVANAAVISRDTGASVFGDASLKVVTNNGVANEGTYTVVTAETAATTEYTISCYMAGSGTVVLFLWDAVGGYQPGPVITLTGQWTRYDWTATFGVGAVRQVGVQTNAQQDITYYAEAWQLETSDFASSYCDGSLGTGYAWTGAAHASTSTRAVTVVNLDAHAGLISSNATLSFRVVAQMPYDADATWPSADNANLLFDTWAAGDRLLLYFSDTTNKIAVHIDGADRLESAALSFKAGDWLDIIVTLDFTANDYNLFINGELIDNDTTNLAAQAVTKWKLGCHIDGVIEHGGFAFDEHAVFNRVLTAIEVAGLYALDRPMVDVGALDSPGIFILDGRFKIASSTTGNRIEITADELAGYDSGGTLQFELRSSDGKALAGAGAVVLDETGLYTIGAGITGDTRRLRFLFDDAGTERLMARVYGNYAGGASPSYLWLHARRVAGDPWNGSQVTIGAEDQVAATGVYIYVQSDGIVDVQGTTKFMVDKLLRVGTGGADPVAALENGCLFYRTDTHKLRLRANGAWVDLN